MQLIKPRNISVEEKVPGRSAKVVFEPLERGFGTTIGNSLRRMLLSSLPGSAVTSVIFEGVAHEYDTIKGVREDVMDIILSLKTLDVRMEGNAATLSINVKGPAVVTAADIQCPAGVMVLNPELVLAHLNDDGQLKFEAKIQKGRGYDPASERDSSERTVGALLIDASFSPVRRVSTRVEAARVGQKTNYDKLIMEIETNGALSPQEAINEAAKIIADQLAVFVDFSALDKVAPSDETTDDSLEELLAQPIEHLDLSVRSMNCLKSDDIFRIGDLVQRSEQAMLRTPNFGRKSLNEIKEVLENLGLELGMELSNWPPKDESLDSLED